MPSLQKLFELSWSELWVLTQATVLLFVVRLSLRFVTVTRLQQMGDVGELERTGLPPKRIAHLVRVAADHGPVRARCLEQSLVLRWLLLRRGVDARIKFGARKHDDQMEAHAWVEVDGVAINEEHDFHRDFAPLEGVAASN